MRHLIHITGGLILGALIFPGHLKAMVYVLDPAPLEKLIIFHDREQYLAGDTIRLKIMNTDRARGRMCQLSSTAYVELVGRGGQPESRTKVCLTDATGTGWMAIPEEVATDYYYIRAYTSWMKNSGPESFSYSLVSIVNRSMPLSTAPEDRTKNPGIPEPGDGDLRIGFEETDLDEKKFRCREEVQFSVSARDHNGTPVSCHLSASVYLVGSRSMPGQGRRGEIRQMSLKEWSPAFGQTSGSDTRYFPELFGPAVSGQVVEKGSGQPAADQLITCTSLGSAFQFQGFRTGCDGRFRFVPRNNASSIDLVFQVPGDSVPPEFLFDDPYYPKFPEVTLPPWEPDESQHAFFEQLSVNRQVMEIYGEPVVPGMTVPEREPGCFYGLPSETVDLDDYIALPVMEEVFRELVRSVILYRRGGALKLGVIDGDTREIIGDHPLFLLDGIPFYSHQKVLDLDPGLIGQIHVVDSRYFVGEMEFDGIIDLRSARGRASETDLFSSMIPFRHQGYEPALPVPVSPAPPERDVVSGENLPDFRSLLYWNPALSADARGNARIAFTMPDVQGVYRVVVEALSEDGLRGRCQFDFEAAQ